MNLRVFDRVKKDSIEADIMLENIDLNIDAVCFE